MSNYSIVFRLTSVSYNIIYFKGADDVDSGGNAVETPSFHDDTRALDALSEEDAKKMKNKIIFDSCITNRGAGMSMPELKFGLEAFGVYVNTEELNEEINKLSFIFPLNFVEFIKVTDTMKAADKREPRLCTVPYARRGLTLRQIKSLQAGLLGTGWLQNTCKDFNLKNDEEIKKGEKFKM